MKVFQTSLPEVLILEPRVFPDPRGHFYEMWVKSRYGEVGVGESFVQDNVSRSIRGTLRGLHFQEPKAQGKLIIVLTGRIFDVAVDIRPDSPRFKKWAGIELNGDHPRQLWVPPGFAHGFCVLSEKADFLYKCTEYYNPATEQSIRWNDPELGIDWPIADPVLSEKDAAAPLLSDAPVLPSLDTAP